MHEIVWANWWDLKGFTSSFWSALAVCLLACLTSKKTMVWNVHLSFVFYSHRHLFVYDRIIRFFESVPVFLYDQTVHLDYKHLIPALSTPGVKSSDLATFLAFEIFFFIIKYFQLFSFCWRRGKREPISNNSLIHRLVFRAMRRSVILSMPSIIERKAISSFCDSNRHRINHI